MAKTIFHAADSRGYADHGWLKSSHSFSFASYYNAERMHFGALRVLNDDMVNGGGGFGSHPHDNMEIISIPLEGDLEHRDNMGNTTVIRQGDVQVMSAGTGVYHSEYNRNKDQAVKFLQIWLFPNKLNVQPRYDQISLDLSERQNKLQQVVSPDPDDAGTWIHQDAWFHMGRFDAARSFRYEPKKEGNGIYVFVLEGSFTVDGKTLNRRDALGIWETDGVNISSVTDGAEVLIMDVPMLA